MLLTFKTPSVNKLQYTESRYMFFKENIGCVLAARPKVGHEKLVFSHALKRQDRSSVLLLSMTGSWTGRWLCTQ